jgi:CubicO group peptidase (beta-lactamase class C family)
MTDKPKEMVLMYGRSLLPLLICSLFSPVFAGKPVNSQKREGEQVNLQRHWSCFTASGAQVRKQQVERGMLPNVVFAGESQPTTVQTRMTWHKVPAVSVAVIRNGKLDWSATWGRLKIDGPRAGCSTLFQAGSLSKPVTLLAALRIAEQGLIHFDKNIETYLTSYHLPAGKQTDANPVTFGNLLAHTSGVTPGGYLGYIQGQPIPSDQQTVCAEPPSNSRKVEVLKAPGTVLAYSGGGYTVAEIALQDALHKPFELILREWLFVPVGMREADFTQPLPTASHSYAARGHLTDGGVVPGGWNNHPEQAAAGLWATASDMAAFLIEIGKGYRGESKVFARASLRKLLSESFDGHAYGFRLIGKGEQVFITHYGGNVGYRAGMTLNLTTGDGAVYLTNSDNGSNFGREFFSAVSRVYHWPMFREVQVTRATQPVDVLQSLTGRYVFADSAVSVVYENNALTLVFPNGDRYAMTPIQGAPREFIHPTTAVRASFEGEGAGLRIYLYGQTGRRQPSGH